jgi:hypothetical protein
VCLFSVLCVVITCVLMTCVEHDPMQEILAKPLYVTSLELVLEFRPSEPALRVTVSKLRFEIRRSRAALRVTLSAAQSRRYALRGLPLGILRYIQPPPISSDIDPLSSTYGETRVEIKILF